MRVGGSQLGDTPDRPRVHGEGHRNSGARGPAPPRPARHRPKDRDAPANPGRSPHAGLILGVHTLRPRPRRSLRSSGVAAPASLQPYPPAAPAWAARRAGSGPRIPGRRPGARPIPLGARVCGWGLTAKGGGALAEAGDSPKYTVLSHLGHLEAMVGAPCRLAPSARARLRVAAAAAPAPPTRLSESPLVSRPGRGVEIPSPGSRSREWGSRPGGGAPARRAGDGRTCLAPLGPAREVASAVARPRLACFHGNVGAAGRGVRGPFCWGESWPAGPRPGRAAPGHTNECPDGGPARHSRLRRPGSPREDPTPTLPRSRFPLLLGFYSNGREAGSELDSWRARPPGPGPVPPPPRPTQSVVPKAQREEGRAPATSKNSERNAAGRGRGRPAAGRRAGLCWALEARSRSSALQGAVGTEERGGKGWGAPDLPLRGLPQPRDPCRRVAPRAPPAQGPGPPSRQPLGSGRASVRGPHSPPPTGACATTDTPPCLHPSPAGRVLTPPQPLGVLDGPHLLPRVPLPIDPSLNPWPPAEPQPDRWTAAAPGPDDQGPVCSRLSAGCTCPITGLGACWHPLLAPGLWCQVRLWSDEQASVPWPPGPGVSGTSPGPAPWGGRPLLALTRATETNSPQA